ncbi:MAG: CotH kinase family protein [Niabella sp.]
MKMKYPSSRLLVIFYLVLIAAFLSSCSKSDREKDTKGPPVVDTRDSTVKISSFIIEKKNNPQLPADITFQVQGDSITGKLSRFYYSVTPSFTSNATRVTINGVEQTTAANTLDLRNNITYSFFAENGKKHDYKIGITWNDSLPHISINTAGNAPVVSKEDYIQASINIDGKNIYSNYSGTTQIRGRGNSTWGYPKKPYRLKLETKADLFGLSAEKDWVLIANYLDETHLLNNIAFNIGRKLNIPFTNSAIPVELTLNGQYKGIYLFTEQVEVESNRVNIGNDGLLLELDSYYDEDPKFQSDNFQLPVMIKDPEVNDPLELAAIKAQFQQMENLVYAGSFPDNNYLDYIDTESFVNYLIVFLITDNEEMNHPKSIYMNKKANGKFVMGPLWDFDWAYGYESSGGKHFSHYNRFFWSGAAARPGTRFFQKFLSDPKITALLKQKWAAFSGNNDLHSFIDHWSFILKGAREKDYSVWKRGNINYETDIAALKTWLTNRISYLTSYINSLP